MLSRFTTCFAPVFIPPEFETPPELQAGESGIDRLKRLLRWRGDEAEVAWLEETGWSMMLLACAMDDEAAVDELLKLPKDELDEEMHATGGKLLATPLTHQKMGAPRHRAEPFGQLLCAYAEGMTPLMAAMTFARTSIVTKLLDAGADLKKSGGQKLLGEWPCHFRGSILAGRVDNTIAFLDRFPQFVNSKDGKNNTCLHYACMIGRTNDQAAIIKELLARGASKSLHVHNLFHGTPLHLLCNVYDGDPESIRLLIEAGGDKLLKGRAKLKPMVRFMLRPLSGMLGKDKGLTKTNPIMYGLKRLINSLSGNTGATPVHNAAERGDILAMEAFIKSAPDTMTKLKDKRGKTPLEVAMEVTAKSSGSELVPKMIEDLVRAAEAAQLHEAPKDAAAATKGKAKAAATKGKAKYQVGPEPPVEATAGGA